MTTRRFNLGQRGRTRGFTLIELLVVLAIVALLISIIAPALSRARETGRRTVCASNMRQVGQSFWHYAEDYDGWFPAKPAFGAPGADVQQLAGVQHLGSRNPTGPEGWGLQFAGMIRDIVEREETRHGTATPKYLLDPKILVCPSDVTGNVYSYADGADPVPQIPVKAAVDFTAIDATNTATEKNYSYMYVSLFRNDDRADFFLMADESDRADNATDSLTGLTTEDNHGRRGINVLYCDLRVEWASARGGDFGSLQDLAWKLWAPIVLAPHRYPESSGNRSSEVQTID
ncbi:MAG: type II secretion system protein [Planctomycetota bacterium]